MLSNYVNLLPHNYSLTQWVVLCICAVCVGLNKTAMPGMGVVVVPLIASFFPAGSSTGLLLVMLATGDLMAVGFYHRHAKWKYILRLLPAALAGMAAGTFVIRRITDVQLAPVIGVIVIVMLALNYLRGIMRQDYSRLPHHVLFAAVMGFLAGLTTQLANAAGPIMVIYLLAMNLPKLEFIGTGAWFFLIVNWIKVPIFISEGRITTGAIASAAIMLPLIVAGAVAGLFILKKVPQKWFNIAMQIFAAMAAIKLLF
jgi:uncharacterized membrane protein YfcA